MNYKEIEQLAEQGRLTFSKGIFPNEIIENIKDRRVIKDLLNKIFYSKAEKKPQELNETEKKERARRLRVEKAFGKYLDGIRSIRKAPYYLIVFSLILFGFEYNRSFGNYPFAVFTLVQGVIVLVWSFNLKLIKSLVRSLILIIVGIQLLELIVFQLPTPMLYGNDIDLSARLGAFWQLLNAASPFLYLGAKLGIILSLVTSMNQIRKFLIIKLEFESVNSHSKNLPGL